MSSASKLIVFTYSYPYGFGEEWKYNEFEVLARHFEQVLIQPYTYGNNSRVQKAFPPNITLNAPLVPRPISKIKLLVNGLFNLAPIGFAIDDLIERKVFSKPKHFMFWLNSILLVRHLASHPYIKGLTKQKSLNTVLYFYWGTGPALLLPLLNPKNFSKVVAKFHGGDLYEERSGGYLPFRRAIFNCLTQTLFISEQGFNYASKRYKVNNGKVFRLGVKEKGLAGYSKDDILRVITCSSVIPVKRLTLLVKALHKVQCPVVWTHIGDGPLLTSLQEEASSLPKNVTAQFLGFVPASKVQSLYAGEAVDLFINVSESEGIPVSIMEALSAGIPILATNVGGTSEIVNATNGRLVAPDISAIELAKEINAFYNLPLPERLALREGAFTAFEEKSNAEKQYSDLAHFLLLKSQAG